jgi:hypothetical protein
MSALAICWNPSTVPLRSTTRTIELWKQELAWGCLPPTFQDAVDVVRRLGLRYLGIDSLCILQDDADDWQQQAVLMADIYQNSHRTLAAAAAADSKGGLYQRNPEYNRHSCIIHHPMTGEPFTVHIRKPLPHRLLELAPWANKKLQT